MNESAFPLAYLRDPRLSAHAIDAAPAWLWSEDGTRLLWANAAAAAAFDAPSPAVLASRRFDAKHPAVVQVARIAGTLPLDAAPRLERLRGFGAGLGGALTCACSRISLPDDSIAVLVVAAEPIGPSLALEERVRRLVEGMDAPVAIFSAAGTLFHAAPPAAERLAAATTLEFLGADALASHALRAGYASGPTKVGAVSIERIGKDAATFLIATLPAQRTARADAAAATPPVTEALPAAEAQVKADVTMPQPSDAESDIFADETKPAEVAGDNDAAASMDAAAATNEAAIVPPLERRYPLRFVWKMDAAGRFTIESGDFIRLTGARTAGAMGRSWDEIVRLLGIDMQGHVAQAIATRDTWSGITIDWPVDGTGERLAVELSGLPVFDRDRVFGGYRGFGVCRDARRLSAAASLRATPASEPAPEKAGAAPAAESQKPAREEPPVLTVVPPAKNVVPFRAAAAAEKTPTLSPVERNAFRELAKQLTSRLQQNSSELPAETPPQPEELEEPETAAESNAGAYGRTGSEAEPVGFIRPEGMPSKATQVLARAEAQPGAGTIPPGHDERGILERLPVGVLVYRLDTLLYANAAFLRWSGYANVGELSGAGGLDVLFVKPGAEKPSDETGQPLTVTSNKGRQQPAEARLFTAAWDGETAHVLMLLPEGVDRRAADGPRLAEAEAEIRQLKSMLDTAKQSEEELINAKRQAESASSAKSEFLAKLSHEIRTPLNSIIGFSEVMMDERFGPIANDRYREYLKDIHASGGHLVSLLNDLLDLSKIEAGKLELTFTSVNLNELTQQCVALLQPQANQARIIIRTSLPPILPTIMADARSVRQIVLNLLSNSIKFTGAGGQVIVSTALTDDGEVVLRVRDTGLGMSEKEIEMALEPFRQLATSSRGGSGGSGLGLPLTKALTEANHARFSIKSAMNAGTLVEISFPRSRVLAD